MPEVRRPEFRTQKSDC